MKEIDKMIVSYDETNKTDKNMHEKSKNVKKVQTTIFKTHILTCILNATLWLNDFGQLGQTYSFLLR